MEVKGGERKVIAFDFDYYKPKTMEEAVTLFSSLKREGKQPVYYSGGTEIITLGRLNLLYTDAVIDIKGIPECRQQYFKSGFLHIGSALSLTEIEETNEFPLLTQTASEVADHTSRSKITLGGNICGNIFYREAILPFLLADSQIVFADVKGTRTVPIHELFHEWLQLRNEECLIQLQVEQKYLKAPFVSIKRRKQWDVGYPLITVASLKVDEEIRVAISGLCPYPFRSKEMEVFLNQGELSNEEKINQAILHVPSPILDDVEGSADYRLFVLKNTLADILARLEGA